MQDKCDKYNSLFEYFSLAASAYKETQCKLTREIEKKGRKKKRNGKTFDYKSIQLALCAKCAHTNRENVQCVTCIMCNNNNNNNEMSKRQ